MEPVLREPTPADAEALGRMHHASWVEAYSGLLPASFWDTFLIEDRVALWRRVLESRDEQGAARVVLAQIADEVVGLASSGPSGWAPHDSGVAPVRDRQLWTLYLLAAHHGSGLGQRLLDAVIEPANRRSCGRSSTLPGPGPSTTATASGPTAHGSSAVRR